VTRQATERASFLKINDIRTDDSISNKHVTQCHQKHRCALFIYDSRIDNIFNSFTLSNKSNFCYGFTHSLSIQTAHELQFAVGLQLKYDPSV
jgi:hypothetical protein